MMSTSCRASAPAKVILFGEHFVVYGKPALLAAVNRRTTATAHLTQEPKIVIKSDIGAAAEYGPSGVNSRRGDNTTVLEPIQAAVRTVLNAHRRKVGVDLKLTSDIPDGIGLGSSAAACVATVAAVDSLFSPHQLRWICDNAIEAERTVHKNSSGADCYISTFGGIIRYKNGRYSRVNSRKTLYMVVGSTGVRHSTGALVEKVRKFRDVNMMIFGDLSEQAGEISLRALKAVERGDIDEIGRLMLENQALLRAIGVSHPKSEEIIDLCLKAGALGAKLTGAGGGGAVISLASSMDGSKRISARLFNAGYEPMEVQIDREGLVVEGVRRS